MTDNGKLIPFEYQKEVVQDIEDFEGRSCVSLEMGLGKTLVALLTLKRQKIQSYPAVVVCPASVKYQWEAEAVRIGIRPTVLEGTKPPESTRKSTPPRLSILNYDILKHWLPHLLKQGVSTVIFDECFFYDTLVLTDTGWIPIGDIVENHLPVRVASFNHSTNSIGWNRVTQYIVNRTPERTVDIHHQYGVLRCTLNHPIWVEGIGYVKAESITSGDRLRIVWDAVQIPKYEEGKDEKILLSPMRECGCQSILSCCHKERRSSSDLQDVWNRIYGPKSREGEEEDLFSMCKTSEGYFELCGVWQGIFGDSIIGGSSEVLFQFMCNQVAIEAARISRQVYGGDEKEDKRVQQSKILDRDRSGYKKDAFGSHEERQPYVPAGNRGQDGREEGWPALEGKTRREWTPVTMAENSVEGSWTEGMGFGTLCQDRNEIPVSTQLQSGYWQGGFEDRHRNRRSWSPSFRQYHQGQEKGSSVIFSRVEGIEIHERTDRCRLGNCCKYDKVYNLEVENDNNYFADKVLVHNCQTLGNRRSQRTRAALKLGRSCKHVIALSGTPLVNRPAELWPTLHMIRPDLYPSFWTFCQRFCKPRRTPWGWDFSGASNLDILHSTLTRQMMVRRLKKDVLKDLPEKMRCVVPVEISDRKEYELARDDFVGWLKSRQADRVQSALRAQQMTQIGYLLRLCARLKLRAVVDWCNEFLSGSDEKLVVFAVHRKMIEALDRRLEGGKHVVIDGQVGGRFRKAAVDQFQRDPSTRVLIGNVKAAGVGLTLTAASNVAFAELYWTPGAMTQAEDRCHRIGTTSTVWAHYLVAHGTIEERLCKAIQDKQSTIRTVLDGGVEEDDLSILDMLVEELKGPGLLQ
jgi:hypothetical protein